jgi:biotin carboxyl carrier protein
VNFMLALNVVIYGLGIIFLALLVLLVAIMVLSKVFSMKAGKDMRRVSAQAVHEADPPAPPRVAAALPVVAPAASPAGEAFEPVIAPLPGKVLSVAAKAGNQVRRGDELCVIEAMKMGNSVKAPRDGVVAEVRVAPGDAVTFGAPLIFLASSAAAAAAPRPAAAPAATAPAPPPAAGPTGLMLTVAGVSHAAEVAVGPGGTASVRLDGSSYQTQRDPSDEKRILVNGQPHTVEVKDMAGTSATVLIDGVPQKLEIAHRALSAPVALSIAHDGKPHKVEVRSGDGGASTVLVDGSTYQVERDKTEPTRILVNGQPHTVEVKDTAGTSAAVLIDGRTERLEIAREAAAAPTASMPVPAAVAAVPTRSGHPGAGERITAPLPGKVLSVAVKTGESVHKGDELCVIEAMKMGNSIRAQRDGSVREVLVVPGQSVTFGASLLVLD